MTEHEYMTTIEWTGTTAGGYRSFSREHAATLTATQDLAVSADAAFRGDAELTNPEQLLVLAASSCQMLSFLGAAARASVDVVSYVDAARGAMPLGPDPVAITEIELRPVIRVRGARVEDVVPLVHQAHEHCYIANSLRSEVRVDPTIEGIP